MTSPKTRRRGANGMGSISERRDGRWEGRATYTKPDGSAGRKVVYGRTSEEVQRKMVKLLSDLQRGLPVRSDERETVAEYVDDWLANRRDLSANVIQNYRSHLEKYVRLSRLGHMRLVGVQPSDVRLFVNGLLDAQLANSTVRHVLAVVSGAFKTAASDGLVPRNPCSLVRMPKPSPPRTHTLTPTEIQRIWACCDANDPLYAMWVLAPTLGLRQGELLALTWNNVRLEGANPEIVVDASVKRVKGEGLVRGAPKTEASVRTIPLGTLHVEVLRRQRALQEQIRQDAGTLWNDNNLVFCTTNPVPPVSFGKMMDARSIRRKWMRLLDRAGVERVEFHALRHTAFTRMAEAEVNPETIRQLAGHSDVRVTLSTYTHPTRVMKQQAVAVVEELYALPRHEQDDDQRATG